MHQNQLFNLLRDNKGRGSFKAEVSENETTIFIYDVIVRDSFFGGVSSADVINAIRAAKTDTIHLRIDTPGGDVFAGRAIEQAIKEHPAHIIAHVDGFAASAGSYIAIAADKVVMGQGAFMMIHKAWSFAMGNSDELVKVAGLLSDIDQTLIETYAKKTKQDPVKIAQWMKDETWFNAKDAVSLGFADEVFEGNKNKSAKASWNLAAYSHAPEAQKEIPEEEPKEEINLDHLKRKLDLVNRTA